jgi:hypothetical protein
MLVGRSDNRHGCWESDWHAQHVILDGIWPGGQHGLDEETEDSVGATQVGPKV